MSKQTEVGIKFTNKVTGQADLEKMVANLRAIKSVLKGFDKSTLDEISDSSKAIKDVAKEEKEINKTSKRNELAKVWEEAKNAGLRLYRATVKLTSASSDYLENLNLFAVAFSEAGKEAKETTKEAMKFTNTISQMYGLDESWVIETTGKFKQLANAMGLGTETGTQLAELLTRMSLDISSLYNVDFDRASSVLQSSLAGQTKPIRGLAGGDITQATLQTTLDNLGIDRKIADLSYAEKRLVIIISLTQQLQASVGDLGNTIEQPANQMRVLNSQWERLTRAVGNVFMPLVQKILPYLNGIIMALTEIINLVATLFGFSEEEPIANANVLSSYIDDMAEGLDTAADNAKKLKSGLRGFDKLNNITTPSANAASAGTGGIGADIMGAFGNAYKNYMSQLDGVQMKATKIRDTILEWLGFTVSTDEETKKLSVKFDHITGGTVLGALLGAVVVGGTLYKGLKGILGILKLIGVVKTGEGSLLGKLLGKGAGNVLSDTGKAGKAAEGLKFKLPDFKTVLKGIGELALIIAACAAIVAAFGALNKIDGFSTFMAGGIDVLVMMFSGLNHIILPLIAVSALCAGLGVVGVVALEGLGWMAAIIAGVGLIVAAFGGLAKIEGIQEFTSGGIDLLCLLFEGIGRIAGVLIGGILEGIGQALCNTLEMFGTSLSNFYTNAKPFLDGIDGYSSGTFDAIVGLSDALLKLTASSLLNQLSKWLGLGDKSLEAFGMQLAAFGPYFSEFASSVSDVSNGVIEKSKIIAEAMDYIVSFAEKIPNEGGLLGLIAGENNVDKFGEELASFGANFATYSDNVSGISGNVVEQSKKINESMNYIIDFARRIPNEGGMASWFVGDNGIKSFGSSLKDFGDNFKKYSDTVKGIATEKVDKVTSSISTIVDEMSIVKSKGLISTIKDFGDKLKDAAKDIKDFYNNAFNSSSASNIGWSFGYNLANSFKNGFKSVDLPTLSLGTKNNNIGTYKITAYAGGGLPPVGQLFLANEKGPELVGSLGGQSFVANQNQILDMIGEKMNKGQSINPTIIVQVGNKELAREVITNLQDMAKTNGRPIQIGG